MKTTLKVKIIIAGICTLFLLSTIPSFAQPETRTTHTLQCDIDFSEPLLSETNNFNEIIIESTGVTTEEGCPMLPTFSKTFEFPLGTKILSVDVQPFSIQTKYLEKHIRPVPSKHKIDNQIVPLDGSRNETVYASAEPYPTTWYTVISGAGVNKQNDHTLFVTVRITPVRYSPATQLILYAPHFSIRITADVATPALTATDTYPLVIITPEEFSEMLQPLVDHKNAYNLLTTVVTLEDIYSTYFGRDHPEQIKYFIKYAVETWDTHYVLLVGDMKKLPIRFTYASWWERDLLSDLYYADIYDAYGDFCSWDSNGNNRFGEIDHDGNDLDGVDLYADVHIGRLACADETEVTTIMNKIITYEKETYNQIWFKRLILAGGDTFPVSYGAQPFVFEGEITNIKVGQTLPDFNQIYLWTSKYTLNPATFNQAITKGAGFVSYAGHGFEHGWGTFRPNAITRYMIYYYMPFIKGITNGDKLPIIFFDACLTAKLDFNITDLQNYYPRMVNLLARVFGLSSNPLDFYQCFAWSFLAKESGGAIATIGATRTAYTRVDANGVYGGAGYLDVHFFDSYENDITVGQMLTASQYAYIQNVGPDYFTIEEFILLGDPSLRVGGYP
ncbi:MAG: hypothetical protein BV458_01685 [Thermoplasmata archaeon M9B2D]|nr:MAG: hypothetical protein BV458_01685 [Thermoplasmata archaeon M9B2D]